MASSSSSFERTLAKQLRSVGNCLLNAPCSVDKLLALLFDAEDLLANMEQGPSDPLQDSLLPLMKALIADSLLTHSVEGVRVSVTYCLTEIMRISAPLEPFNDDQMKVIFELIVEAFSKLSQASTQYYEKVLSILETVARVKACLLMLDLQCNALVVRMFHSFWAFIRSDPADDILWAVEQIMTDILSKSEDISLGLLNPLLASVLKGNKNVSPSCWKLGERVITSCAAKLAPVLHGAVQSNGTTVDDYSPVVASVCENEPTMENHHVNGSSKPVVANGLICFPGKVVPDLDSAPGFNTSDSAALLVPNDVVPVAKTSTDKADSAGSKGPTKLEIDLEALPKKREWKPNKLLNPAEGHDLSWLYVEAQKSGQRRVLENGSDLSAAPKNSSRKRRMQQKVNIEPDAGESTVERSDLDTKLPIKQSVERAEPSSRFPLNVGGDESNDDESSEDNVYEIRFRSKDVQLKCPSSSSSDDSTPEASPPRYITVKSKDVRLQSTSDDSTPEGSPPRPWGLWRSHFRHP